MGVFFCHMIYGKYLRMTKLFRLLLILTYPCIYTNLQQTMYTHSLYHVNSLDTVYVDDICCYIFLYICERCLKNFTSYESYVYITHVAWSCRSNHSGVGTHYMFNDYISKFAFTFTHIHIHLHIICAYYLHRYIHQIYTYT